MRPFQAIFAWKEENIRHQTSTKTLPGKHWSAFPEIACSRLVLIGGCYSGLKATGPAAKPGRMWTPVYTASGKQHWFE